MLPLNKLLTTIVTDMDFDEEPDLCWNGINEDALREISDLLALSDTMHQRWLNLD